MATPAELTRLPIDQEAACPPLEAGDRLTRAEFERRYARMPQVKKAELIERTVYVPSPVRASSHSEPHSHLGCRLGTYAAQMRGVRCFHNPTVRLDFDNEPQPDLVLSRVSATGGHATISSGDYLEGSPELVVEILGSSRAYDLHQKKDAYRRNGVREYLAWITSERRLVGWQLVEGEYKDIAPDAGAVLKSVVFPGLWLDAKALLTGDMQTVLATLRSGMAGESAERRG